MATYKLADISTRAPKGLSKEKTKAATAKLLQQLDELQNLLYAQHKHAVLVVLQGMDASGKDGLIRNVFGHLNPQGVRIQSFKEPTPEELDHDFLWRIHRHTPPKGMIQVFNRSHYEDVLVTRVHNLCNQDDIRDRMHAINHFEQLLHRHNNTHILKFYLHVSEKEQQQRLQERIANPTKQWKYNENDFKEARLRSAYYKAYEDCFTHCNKIPWTIVPADQNWYKEFIIAQSLYNLLTALHMQYPGLKK